VDEDFIQDDFNLCSLATQVTYYKQVTSVNHSYFCSAKRKYICSDWIDCVAANCIDFDGTS
jgi:Casein kinase II regulatory subunit